MRRKPIDSQAAIAEGVDFLLREFRAIRAPSVPRPSGQGFDQFTGPIEVTYLVAAHNARSALHSVADFTCDGIEDEAEIQIALDLCAELGSGRVVLSEGDFYMSTDQIQVILDVRANVALVGTGRHATRLLYSSSHAFDFSIRYGNGAEIGHMTIMQA